MKILRRLASLIFAVSVAFGQVKIPMSTVNPSPVSGMLKGSGTAIVAGTPGVDYFNAATFPGNPYTGQDIISIPWSTLYEAKRLTPQSDSTPVSSITDSSGNGNTASSSGSSRPLYRTGANGINGQPTIDFSSASSQYSQSATGGLNNLSSFYVAIVFNTTSFVQGSFWTFGQNSDANKSYLSSSSSGGDHIVSVIGGTLFDGFPYGKLAVSTSYFVELVFSGTQLNEFVNGVRVRYFNCSNPGTLPIPTITLGDRPGGGPFAFANMKLALFAAEASVPSDANRRLMRNYVNLVYGIPMPATSFLPLVRYAAANGITPTSIEDDGYGNITIGQSGVTFDVGDLNNYPFFNISSGEFTFNSSGANLDAFGVNNTSLDSSGVTNGYSAITFRSADGLAPMAFGYGGKSNSLLPIFIDSNYLENNAGGASGGQRFVFANKRTGGGEGQVWSVELNGAFTWWRYIDYGTGTTQVKGGFFDQTTGAITVPAGVANPLSGTVTLASGAGTITSSSIDANTIIALTMKTSSGTPGTYEPVVLVSSGSATVTGLSTDNSIYNWIAFKNN